MSCERDILIGNESVGEDNAFLYQTLIGSAKEDDKHFRAIMVLILMLNLLLAACAPAQASDLCETPGTTFEYLTAQQRYDAAEAAMEAQLKSILDGVTASPNPLPGTPEYAVKEALTKSSVLVRFTYQYQDMLYRSWGSGGVVDKSAEGMTIITNRHVVTGGNGENKIPDGARLIELRFTQMTVNDLLIDSGNAVVVPGNYVRAIVGDGDLDVAAVRVINWDGQFDKQLVPFEPMGIDTSVALAAGGKFFYMPRPSRFQNDRLDVGLPVGTIFGQMRFDGCFESLGGVIMAREDQPAEPGESGSIVVDDQKKMVGMLTQFSVDTVNGAHVVRGLVLDFPSGVSDIISATDAITISTGIEKMTLPVMVLGQ